jgi:hypothetical protein
MAEAHTVPRVYLKGFASKHGLVVVDKSASLAGQVSAQKLTSVEKVSTQTDFYVLQRSSGPDETYEQTFQRIEGRIRNFMKHLKTGKLLSREDLTLLAVLAALQDGRSERARMMLADPLRASFASVETDVRARGGTDEDVEAAIDAFVKTDVYDGDALPDPKNLSLLTIRTSVETSTKMYGAMHKCILTSDAQPFVTSDHPVVWVDPRVLGRHRANRASTTCEVTYPLTRWHCLLMAYMPLEATVVADEEAVSVVNARTAAAAEREVYVPPTGDMWRDTLIADLAAHADIGVVGKSLALRYCDPEGMPVSVRDIVESVGMDQSVVDYANAEIIAGLKAAGLGDFSAEHAPRVTPEQAKAQFPRPLRGV